MRRATTILVSAPPFILCYAVLGRICDSAASVSADIVVLRSIQIYPVLYNAGMRPDAALVNDEIQAHEPSYSELR